MSNNEDSNRRHLADLPADARAQDLVDSRSSSVDGSSRQMGEAAKASSPESGQTISARKDAHIDLCLTGDVGSDGVATGLGGFSLEYDALPEIDLADVDVSVEILGKRLSAPLVVGAMTGGTARAQRINDRLGEAAARTGIAMALGSQRAMIVRPELAETFDVKRAVKDVPLLFGNVGAVQLNYGVTPQLIADALLRVGADAVNFHLNPLQEAIQPEGDTRFGGLAAKIREAAALLPVPVLVKEVGAGIGPKAAKRLAGLPIAGVETAGVGGTSWARVESHRAPKDSVQAEVGRRLAGYGISTAASVLACRKAFARPRLVIASGGVRTGYDVAVAIALGADACALARPLLVAAEESVEAAIKAIETIVYELKVICFCAGAKNLAELAHTRVSPNPEDPRR